MLETKFKRMHTMLPQNVIIAVTPIGFSFNTAVPLNYSNSYHMRTLVHRDIQIVIIHPWTKSHVQPHRVIYYAWTSHQPSHCGHFQECSGMFAYDSAVGCSLMTSFTVLLNVVKVITVPLQNV